MEQVIDSFINQEQINENSEKIFLDQLKPYFENPIQPEQLPQIQRIPLIFLQKNFSVFLQFCLQTLPKKLLQPYQEYLYKKNQGGFLMELKKKEVQIDKKFKSIDDWCLYYIFEQMITEQNYIQIVEFIFDNLQQTKLGFEKNLIILEILMQIVEKAKYTLNFNKVLECIYQFLGICLMKYKKQKDSSNKKNYYYQCEKILSDYINRLVKKFVQDFKTTKDNLKVQDLIEYDIETLQRNNKSLNPLLVCKHYVVVFIMDMIDGVIEVQCQNQFSQESTKKLLSILQNSLEQMNQNQMDFLIIFKQQIFIQKFEKQEINQTKKQYSHQSQYNIGAISQIFINLFQNKKNIFHFIYDDKFKLQLAFQILDQVLDQEKIHLKTQSINCFQEFFKNLQYQDLTNINEFDIPIDQFLSKLIQFGLYNQNKFFANIEDIFKKIMQFYSVKVQYQIYVNISKQQQNKQVQEYILENVLQFIEKNKQLIQSEMNIQNLSILIEKNMNRCVIDNIIEQQKLIKNILKLLDYISINQQLFNQSIQEYFQNVFQIFSPELKKQAEKELNKDPSNSFLEDILSMINQIENKIQE